MIQARGGKPEWGSPQNARILWGPRVGGGNQDNPRTNSLFGASPGMMNSLIERLRARRSLRASPPRDEQQFVALFACPSIEKPAGGEKQLTWDIYFNYNVSAYYAENAGDVHTGACGAGYGGCVSGAPRGGKCEKMALSPPGADGPQIKWGGSPRRQYETDLSTQEETEKQSARFP